MIVHLMKSQRTKFFFSIITALLFTGCGIPNYFYLGSSYYNISLGTQRTETDESSPTIPGVLSEKIIVSPISITFTDPVQIAKCEDCPSAVIFYWIDKSNQPSSVASSGIKSAFSSTFKKNEPSGGVPLTIYPDAQTAPVIDYQEEVTSKENPDEKIKIPHTLYYAMLSDAMENNVPISSPSFHVPPTTTPTETRIDFEIVMDDLEKNPDGTPNENYKHIYLYQARGTSSESRFELRRYNTASFSTIPENKDSISNGTFNDYSVFTTDDVSYAYQQEEVYVHFAIAFCAAKGKFNNVFWSDLRADSGTSLTFKIGRDLTPETPNT